MLGNCITQEEQLGEPAVAGAFTADRSSGLPVYLQIKYQVIHNISMGRLTAGQVLPSIRQAAKQLGVTPATVRHAYDVLEEEGFVVGYQGKGVVVTDLAPVPRAETAERQSALVRLLRPTVGQALGLGYAPAEVQTAVGLALAETGQATVLFVGAEAEFIDHYTPLVADALRDFRVEVNSIPLQRLEEVGPDALIPLPLCVVTPVRSFPPVRQLLRGVRLPVIALALDLSTETTDALIHLPRDARVMLVAERMNLSPFAHLLAQYVATDSPVVEIALEEPGLSKRLASADVVIHSLRARRATLRYSPSGGQRLEMHFVPNPNSLGKVRDTVQAQRSRTMGAAGRLAAQAETAAVAVSG